MVQSPASTPALASSLLKPIASEGFSQGIQPTSTALFTTALLKERVGQSMSNCVRSQVSNEIVCRSGKSHSPLQNCPRIKKAPGKYVVLGGRRTTRLKSREPVDWSSIQNPASLPSLIEHFSKSLRLSHAHVRVNNQQFVRSNQLPASAGPY